MNSLVFLEPDDLNGGNGMSYYDEKFQALIAAGVPRWFIRLYLIDDLAFFSRVYIYCNPYDVEAKDGWYTTNAVALTGTPQATRLKGDIASLGFPTWDEYKTLFNGDEHDCAAGFMDAYDRHQEEWLQAQERGSLISYSN